MKHFFILIACIAACSIAFSQDAPADSADIILSSSLSDTAKANALVRISNNAFTVKNYTLSQLYASKGIEFFKQKKNLLCLVQLHEPYGDALIKLKNYDSALVVFRSAFDLIEQIGEEEKKQQLKAKFYSRIGKTFERISYDSSIVYYTLSHTGYLSFKNDRSDSLYHTNTLAMLAYSYFITGHAKKGYETGEEAAKMADKLGDNQMKSLSYSVLGTILNEMKLYNKAISTFGAAAVAGAAVNDSSRTGQSYNGIALVYLNQTKYDEALKYYYKALQYINKNTSVYQYTTICYNIIYVLCELDSVKRAEYFLRELTENVTTVKTDDSYFGTLIVLSNFYIKNRNLGKAEEYIDKATELLSLFKSQHRRMDYYFTMYNFYKARGDYKNSLVAFQMHQQFKDSILSQETSEMVAEKNTIYETEKKEQQIILLQKENEIKAANELRAKQVRNFSFAGIAALVVFGGFTYYRYRQRKQLSEQLSKSLTELKETQEQLIETERHREQENVRLRISRDIHDEIGSNLTKISLLSEIISGNGLQIDQQVKSSVAEISEYALAVNNSLSEIIWAVSPRQDTLESLLAYMRSHVHSFLNDSGINFKINFPDSVENFQMNPDLKRNIFLVLKESLNNAVKYSDARNINVNFSLQGRHFDFSLHDDGAGFDISKTASLGNGLNNMAYRMENSNCTFKITSSPGNGCTVSASGTIY